MATLHDTALGSGSGTSTSTADALSVTAGDLVCAMVKWESGNGLTCTVDTGASTPTFATANAKYLSVGTNDHCGQTFYWTATSTGTVTVRASFDGSGSFIELQAYSFTPDSGGNTFVLSDAAVAEGSSNSPSSGSVTVDAAGVAIGSFSLYASATLTPGTGWSQPAELQSSNSLMTEYRLPSGSGTVTADGTVSGAPEWIAQGASFEEVTGGGLAIPIAMRHYMTMQ